MYRATITGSFFLADHHIPLGTYLLENVTAAAVLTLRAGDVEQCAETPFRVFQTAAYGGKVLLIRPGGFGDLLFLTPIIAQLIDDGCEVTVCTHPRYFAILEGQPCALKAYPMLESEVRSFDRVCWMENAVEDSKDETHIIDLFAARVGVSVYDHRCRYTVTDEEREWALGRYPKTHKPRVAIQAKASADCRNVPDDTMAKAASAFIGLGYEVFLFGAPGSIGIGPDSPYMNLTAHGLDIRQSAAVLESCDACVAPDSAICHLAGALDVPTCALYGPFPWQARTRYAPSIFALSGKAPCAPCFHHARTDPWVAGKPCSTAKRCVALAEIRPEDIVRKVKQMIER